MVFICENVSIYTLILRVSGWTDVIEELPQVTLIHCSVRTERGEMK